MSYVSQMKVLEYKVLKTNFELNEHFVFTNKNINIQPSFNRNIERIDDNQYKITLGIKISNEINENPIPFNAEVIISTVFEMSNWESDSLKGISINNATAIMFPYLRTLLSTVTMNGNVSPYNLPIINIAKLFEQQHKTQ